MRELLVLPVFLAVFGSIVPDLVALSEDTGAKAAEFADDMNSAIDCATRAIPISVCSPDLMDSDFSPEMEKFGEVRAEIQRLANRSMQE